MPAVEWTGRPRLRRAGMPTALVLLLLAACLPSSARGAEASWSFEPSSWDFGTVVPGSGPTPPKAFTLTNTGEVELSVIFVSVGGSEGAGFKLAGNSCGKLAPGASCEISVTFDPSTAGPKDGQLAVASQGGLAPQASVELSGTGAGPVVSIAPSSQAFDPLPLGGGPSPRKTFTVANDGQLDLTIFSISIKANQTYNYPGAAPQQFDLAGGTCVPGIVVPPEGACAVEVTSSPTAPGALTAHLSIADNAPGSPHVATLEGFGIAPPWQPPPPPPFIEPRAAIVHRPSKRTRKRHAAFWLRGSAAAARFVCKLDRQQWFQVCEPPVRYRKLRRGRHRFAVRALDGNGRWGRPTVFRWRIMRPGRGR